MRLRVQDLDFHYLCIMVWNGKGANTGASPAWRPELVQSLRGQISAVQRYYLSDLQDERYAGVWLPDALARKYPQANKELGWHYLFSCHPAQCRSLRWFDPSSPSGPFHSAKSGSADGQAARDP